MPEEHCVALAETPYRELCADYPGDDVYPRDDFRVEWGPVFHRGRLDGSARVLVIGQDPAQHETVVRRILVGEAGHRVQGLLLKLGLDRSYVLVNAFLYAVYGQGGGNRHRDDPAIAAYRHRWLDALVAGGGVQAVLALGGLAEAAWRTWLETPAGTASDLPFARVTHPTQPESSSGGDPAKRAAATAAMLGTWNAALEGLRPAITEPDVDGPLEPYGTAFVDGDRRPIPAHDLPAGTPAWMRSRSGWAARRGDTAALKRRTITVTVPATETA